MTLTVVQVVVAEVVVDQVEGVLSVVVLHRVWPVLVENLNSETIFTHISKHYSLTLYLIFEV